MNSTLAWLYNALEFSAGCLALAVVWMLIAWAVLFGFAAIGILFEEISLWRNRDE